MTQLEKDTICRAPVNWRIRRVAMSPSAQQIATIVVSDEGSNIILWDRVGNILAWAVDLSSIQSWRRSLFVEQDGLFFLDECNLLFVGDRYSTQMDSAIAHLKVWNYNSRQVSFPFEEQSHHHVYSLIVSNDKQYAAFKANHRVQEIVLFRFSYERSEVLSLRTRCDVGSLVFSPDARYIGVEGPKMQLVDVATKSVCDIGSGTIWAFSPDGERFVASSHWPWHYGSGSEGVVWSTRSNSILLEHSIRPASSESFVKMDKVCAATFSPSGRHLVSGHSDGSIYVWDGKNYRYAHHAAVAHSSAVRTVLFSGKGNELLTCDEFTAVVWRFKDS